MDDAFSDQSSPQTPSPVSDISNPSPSSDQSEYPSQQAQDFVEHGLQDSPDPVPTSSPVQKDVAKNFVVGALVFGVLAVGGIAGYRLLNSGKSADDRSNASSAKTANFELLEKKNTYTGTGIPAVAGEKTYTLFYDGSALSPKVVVASADVTIAASFPQPTTPTPTPKAGTGYIGPPVQVKSATTIYEEGSVSSTGQTIVASPNPNKPKSGGYACTQVYKPVCGTDGKTYSNSCEANSAGVGILHQDACTPGEGSSNGMVGPPVNVVPPTKDTSIVFDQIYSGNHIVARKGSLYDAFTHEGGIASARNAALVEMRVRGSVSGGGANTGAQAKLHTRGEFLVITVTPMTQQSVVVEKSWIKSQILYGQLPGTTVEVNITDPTAQGAILDTKKTPAPTPISTLPICLKPGIGENVVGKAPLTVTLFAGGAQGGPDSEVVGFVWDFFGDGTYVSDTGSKPFTNTVTKKYKEPGIYKPRFKVVGQNGKLSPACVYPFTISVVKKK